MRTGTWQLQLDTLGENNMREYYPTTDLDELEVDIIVKYKGKVIDAEITDTSWDMVYEDVDSYFEGAKKR